MKYSILAIFSLISLSVAAEPVYYELGDFLQGAKRNPNKCVSKGNTYKCVGYEEIEGAIFNKKTNRYYAYVRNSYSESYVEFACDGFYVEDADGVEKIICGEVTTVKNVECISLGGRAKIYDYDELGILVDEKTVRNRDVSLCRDAFHFQYGNNESKDYAGLNITNADKAERGSREIDDGLAGLLGGGGGGIATKAKGSIRTPSERDIDMGAGNGSRSKSEIQKAIMQRTPGLRHIYNKFLKKKPGFAGKVTLTLSIAPDGEVVKISVASSTTGYKAFDDEIKTAVSRWKFSKVKSGNTTITVPFTFSE